MKIKPEHYQELSRIVEQGKPLIPPLGEYLSAGNSAKRWRWDILWAAKAGNWLGQNIYPYANDNHIDTALRAITGTK